MTSFQSSPNPRMVLKVVFVWILISSMSFAEVKLPAIISDHMVLRKAKNVPVWGSADPNEGVTVSVAGQKVQATAGADGKWMVKLDLKDAVQGPFEMTIEGKNKIVIQDVLIGEVWVASGQSNMEFRLKRTKDADKDISQSNFPMIREFLVTPNVASADKRYDCKGTWNVCTPESAGSFTAVGYHFVKTLFKELNVPVGMIHTSWGGTPVEAWTSFESFEKDPELKEGRDKALQSAREYPPQKEAYIKEFEQWLKTNGREDKPTPDLQAFAGANVSMQDWKPIQMPSKVLGGGVAECGAVWVRGEMTLSEKVAKSTFPISIGSMQAFPAVYVNGERVGHDTYKSYPGTGYQYRYYVDSKFLKEGKNVLAIRFYAPYGNASSVNIKCEFANFDDGLKIKEEYALPPMDAALTASVPKALPNPLRNQDVATYLFNGMITPVLPYGISGAIWYQGENNTGRAVQYRKAFPLMIEDWRKAWGQGDFPFYWCQLANYQDKTNAPGDSGWAELREAQTMTLKLPNTGMAVLIDLGEAKDIHPRNKKDVGERLALWALSKTYGKNIPCSGPIYQSMKINGNKVELTFTNTDKGLVAKKLPATYELVSLTSSTAPLVRNSPSSELEGFAICGEDKAWVWADAKIEGEKVIVWANGVEKPVAVRYAWANNPTCNLYNGADLPAVPFRTDNFPATTDGKKY